MKKIIVLFLMSGFISTAALAQTKDVKKEETVLKNTIKDKKEDKKVVGNDLKNLRVEQAVKDHKEVAHHRKSINRQGKHLEKQGVKHPIEKAKEEIKDEKDMKN